MKTSAAYLTMTMAGMMLPALPALAGPVGAPIDPNDVSMNVQIGNQLFNNILLNWVESIDDVTNRPIYTLSGGPIVLTTDDGSFTIGGATFDPDPVLLFSANATNNSNNALAYSFSFNAPMSPALTGSIISHAEMGVSLTDGLNDGAAIQPLVGQGTMLKSYDLYSSGGSVSKNVDIGTTFAISSGTSTTAYSADSSLFCIQSCVTMSSVLSFTLTAKDSAGFSGKVVQTPVPIPGAVVLLGSGLLGLLGFRRKQIHV